MANIHDLSTPMELGDETSSTTAPTLLETKAMYIQGNSKPGATKEDRDAAEAAYNAKLQKAIMQRYRALKEEVMPKETREAFFAHVMLLICVLPIIYTWKSLSWTYIGYTATFALFMEPFLFTSFHLWLHMTMLDEHQQGLFTSVPFAYFHHYADTSMYSDMPFRYRLSFQSAIGFSFSISMLVLMLDPVLASFVLTFLLVDIYTHEWVHTLPKKYTSWNPLSAKFVGFHWFMKTLEALGMNNRRRHAMEHHKDRAWNQEETTDWVDLDVPISCRAAEAYGNFVWSRFRAYLKVIRGTDRAIELGGCGGDKLWKKIALILFVNEMLFFGFMKLVSAFLMEQAPVPVPIYVDARLLFVAWMRFRIKISKPDLAYAKMGCKPFFEDCKDSLLGSETRESAAEEIQSQQLVTDADVLDAQMKKQH